MRHARWNAPQWWRNIMMYRRAYLHRTGLGPNGRGRHQTKANECKYPETYSCPKELVHDLSPVCGPRRATKPFVGRDSKNDIYNADTSNRAFIFSTRAEPILFAVD